ncbi:MAG: aminotransferase class I/II-fold pyridoxal phosphate-dependent enzyme, partial [Deltaproteobacteria bacterium]|nr:aminotransferase class I/II-fold pyridoxal phosphate-dependent enzyme [Deltaproteobacteria bacterium]
VYLTSPANPGGRALDTKPFEELLSALPDHVTVIVDEAYADFATRDGALQAARCVQWTDQLIVLRSLSKLHGLAGLRIGYAIASRDRARVLERAAPAFPIVRGAAEVALAALSDREHEKRVIDHVVAARTQLEQRLDAKRIDRLASDGPFVLAADPDASGPRVFDRYVMLPAWVER